MRKAAERAWARGNVEELIFQPLMRNLLAVSKRRLTASLRIHPHTPRSESVSSSTIRGEKQTYILLRQNDYGAVLMLQYHVVQHILSLHYFFFAHSLE